MNKMMLLVLFWSGGTLLSIESSWAAPVDWANPEVFRINKEPSRSFFYTFPDRESAELSSVWESDSHQLLNGDWKFHWVDVPEKKPVGFENPDFDDSRWVDFPVPANWEINGYGIPFYRSHACFIPDAVPPQMPLSYNPVGTYRKTFTLDESWLEKETFIHFGAVKSAFYLYVNGKMVGYSQDSKTQAEFNLTSYLKPGENLVALEVYRYSDGSYFECQDMWRMSGIERDVYLYTAPKVRMRDFHAYTSLQDSYRDGVLEFDIDLENHTKESVSSYTVDVRVIDNENKAVIFQRLSAGKIGAYQEKTLAFRNVINAVNAWSAEIPNLYRLELTLNDGAGKTVEYIQRNIGFRSTELKNGNILINGKAVLFKGVNRHEHDPRTGHVISRESMVRDIQMLKQYNFNAVRLSHYPNDPYLYDLADSYGLYVMDEANIESHGIGAANQGPYNPSVHPVNKPEWKAAYLDRIKNMYERSKNSASVVMRSLGNESGDGPNLEASFDWLKAQESSPVISEQAQLRRHTDAYGQMYATIDSITHYAESQHDDRPVILIEYEHAMGNSLGNFKEYWDTFEKYSALQGGFIWDWVDQTFEKTTADGTTFWAYGGDMEPAGTQHDDSFCANGLVDANRKPYPYLYEAKRVHQNIGFSAENISRGKINIQNKYYFSDLRRYVLSWDLQADGVIVARGRDIPLGAAAQNAEIIQLNYNHDFDESKEYFLNLTVIDTRETLFSAKGHSIASGQLAFPFKLMSEREVGRSHLSVVNKKSGVTVSGKGFRYGFDKQLGKLNSINYAGRELLLSQPRPNFWRAPVDNDFDIESYHTSLSKWQNVGKEMALISFSVEKPGKDEVKISTEHFISSIESRYFMTHTIYASGEVNVDVWFYAAPHQKQPEFPRFGVIFELDKNFNSIDYYGRGPHENYWDRKASADIGLYTTSVNDLYVPYVRPQENGLRTDVRHVAFYGDDGKGIQFLGKPHLSFGAEYYSQDDYDQSKDQWKKRNIHPHELKKGKGIYVKIDHRHRGVGGTDSWGSPPLFKYTVPWLDYRYQYAFKPYVRD
ncbi:glycoside hydrolase family 2 TIM barrel-domain containing protein [Teredinibacter haidensis]|uniref:glycoside hydrolase family 2 TIM barrel-domain containing protein n=1 Tax=Teredinibacter haidensis TaxID=2731755 RepID=UPI000948E9F7|nr:glycoside hydrolase family 2 TIM barrel-domain containing protein [Teredinibacter haidensis]